MFNSARNPVSVRPWTGDRHRRSSPAPETSHVDQVQIALAIADEALLTSLLTSSTPAITEGNRVGSVSSTIGVRLDAHQTLDAVLEFEEIHCVLAESETEIEQYLGMSNKSAHERQRDLARLTQCQSELQTLVHQAPPVQTISCLAQAGFAPHHIQSILRLPYDAWHKSWWYTLDANGNFSHPFHRILRTRRYADGTLTLQYRDFFSQEKPVCFKSLSQKVIVVIQDHNQSFSSLLSTINYGRNQLRIEHAILIGDRLSELEARGFVSQGVSLYAASDLILPNRADCRICAQHDCPMSQREDSPVATCRKFCVGEWL